MRVLIILLYSLIALLPLAAQTKGNTSACPVVKIEAERLPDMNEPRCGHSLLLVNGEPTVVGGHTTNFVPTATIEYYKDGKWTLLPSAFTHDGGFAVQLSSDQVLIGGGHERNMGIGQSFEAELYDPLSRTCEGFGSLDTKRALSSVVALDDNRAIITGNWYHDDAIEMYDGKGGFVPVKATSCGRAYPYILRTAKDDAIIFSGLDSKGQRTFHPVIDRLQGEAYHEPLLEEWGVITELIMPLTSAFIGDESKGDYSYLLKVENEQGQVAIARVTNGEFSLLSTDVPVPMTCQWGNIIYRTQVFVDQKSRRAYMLGTDPDKCCIHPKLDSARVYVLTIDYATDPARLTLGYTDVHDDFDVQFTLMTADGNLMMLGGVPTQNNFKPSAATWLLHVSPRAQEAGTRFPWWGWALIILGIAALSTLLIMLSRRRKSVQCKEMPIVVTENPDTATGALAGTNQEAPDAAMDYDELMHRICQLMEEQQLFMNPNLKISDLVTALGTNRSTISACINSQRNCSFPQLVNTYRVARAKELLCSQPDIKIAEVLVKAGFSSEASFYRIFKAITGTTPTDWRRDNNSLT